jgi:hypothetical protein
MAKRLIFVKPVGTPKTSARALMALEFRDLRSAERARQCALEGTFHANL